MQGLDGLKIPDEIVYEHHIIEDEDYTNVLGRLGERKKDDMAGHNLYVFNRERTEEFYFLSVIAPVEPGKDFPDGIVTVQDEGARGHAPIV